MDEKKLVLPVMKRTETDAYTFARHVHKNEFAPCGKEKIKLVANVARAAGQLFCDNQHLIQAHLKDTVFQVAWLHRVFEPVKRPSGWWSPGHLLREKFSQPVVTCVVLLERSKHPGLVDHQWVEQISNRGGLPAQMVYAAMLEEKARALRLDPASAPGGDYAKAVNALDLDITRARDRLSMLLGYAPIHWYAGFEVLNALSEPLKPVAKAEEPA